MEPQRADPVGGAGQREADEGQRTGRGRHLAPYRRLSGWGVLDQLQSLARPLRVRDYRLLWLAQLGSELGDWATRLALILVVYGRTHSASLSAAVVTVSLLPWVGLGQVLTSLVDRFSRRSVMVAADLGRAAVFGVLVLPVPLGVVFAGAFLSGLGTAPFESARHSIRVEVTDDEALYGGAISLFAITSQLATMGGFALGGALVALVGSRVTFAVNAASFVLSALFVSGIRTRSVGRPADSKSRAYLRAAAQSLARDPVLRWCSGLSVTASFAGMGVEAIAAVYGHGHPAEVTLLAVAVPVGSVVSAAVAPHAGGPRVLLRAAARMPLVGGVLGVALFSSGSGVVLGALGFAAAGAAVAVTAPAGPVVARRLDPAFRSPAFSILQGATLGGQAAGAAVGGVLAAEFGARPTCIAACVALALVGLAATVRRPNPVSTVADQAEQPAA